MLFMVVEKFRNQDGKAVYRKLRDSGRGLPDGLKFVASYVSADLGRCFQLMEADDVTLFQRWIADWQERGGVRGRAGGRRQDDARRAGAAAVSDSIAGYAKEAPALLETYERISPEDAASSGLAPDPHRRPSRLLDIGAGSGRDAAHFAAMGHQVVAVEPVDAMREGAMRLHPSPRIEWLADTLPSLALVRARGETFDAVLATAVWMHLDESERARGDAGRGVAGGARRRADPVAAPRADPGGPAHVRCLGRGDDGARCARGLRLRRQRRHRLGSGPAAGRHLDAARFPQMRITSAASWSVREPRASTARLMNP